MTEAKRLEELLQRSFAAIDPAALRALAQRWHLPLLRLRAEAGDGVLPPERVLALVPELLGDPSQARTELDAAASALADQVRGISGAAEALRDSVRAAAGPLAALRAATDALPDPQGPLELALARVERALSARLPLPEADRALQALTEAAERLGRVLQAGGFQSGAGPELVAAGAALAELDQALTAAPSSPSPSLPAALWELADLAAAEGEPLALDLRVLAARIAEAEGSDPRWPDVFAAAIAAEQLPLARSAGQRVQVAALAPPGDLPRVAAVAEQVAELAARLGDRRAECLARLEVASVYGQTGRLPEAVEQAKSARERASDLPTWARAELVLAQLREAQGDLDGARRSLQRVVGLGQTQPAFPAETARAAIALGRLEWVARPDRALTLLVAGREIARRTGDWPTWAAGVQAAAERVGPQVQASLLQSARREVDAAGPEAASWSDWLRVRFKV